ncbi:hypothetical protein [Neptunomonas antarctica]|uniref:Uncharacterized protein n=1 Tax=Neptunomonas antarctica TaxID=619304 RepID=A0A1N7M261_9GAMM|nr:hypothetical protein [Neptunomonas antarctica]SIS80195.1 hypothetical protein SAMN05421760_105100 [Neptunomonas antarctica]
MLYVLRNTAGRITSLSETLQEGAEVVDLKNPEVMAFLSMNGDMTPDAYLDQSDTNIARIVEDLVELMVSRNLIIFTDLPSAAQRKLLTRKLARKLINKDDDDSQSEDENTSILSDDESWL